MKTLNLLVLSSIVLTSCKKEFECRCMGPIGIYKTYAIKANRYQATKKCKEYTEEEHKLKGSDVGCSLKSY